MGCDVDNTTFADHSWYFRNSVVRANYNNIKIGVFETTEFLELFFRNLLINEENILKNRTLHINFKTGYSSDANNNDMQSTKNII